ncbi:MULTISPECIES: MarR family winged helix-turn-helix transcriptional regulator [unclassified Microbacterium]|uniref:MarR family winged helix-turn-helix transcriptional regulator n=1 Tax=unclassified Microbacterium TaxID=2609290 RepID=UPI000CFBF548|nr:MULTISPECIES: MarR family transcriptional regulator [unclassified Microbacterium]PQZ49736.1 MarR family transcriptional regulator [Microbacterium sp. MYb43]PQZ72571.1 MarR family transcriptional regulator [Microbacterium sp. MYb40]PRB15287.1 MarR family transcriptional regulator [Microbacterium sp. MYb54]PRB25325.1 MarR family transcriptional regulator [Microbacterium sp. MYb50]PRB59839.1 MarR family transcriptional regulator [Microbacterium sp. MYb24]
MTEERRRRTPTPDQLRIWRDFIETGEQLRARLATQLQNDSSLSSGDYQVLLALSEADGHSARSSELAALIDWERSRLSHHLGRMEKRGLVRRVPCADGAHGVDVLLTDEGAEAFRAANVPHLRAIRELFVDALSPEQLVAVDDVTTALRRHLRPGSDDASEEPASEQR